ncbi:hypothetical protein ABER98_06685 [Domibacillus aminovorans]
MSLVIVVISGFFNTVLLKQLKLVLIVPYRFALGFEGICPLERHLKRLI